MRPGIRPWFGTREYVGGLAVALAASTQALAQQEFPAEPPPQAPGEEIKADESVFDGDYLIVGVGAMPVEFAVSAIPILLLGEMAERVLFFTSVSPDQMPGLPR